MRTSVTLPYLINNAPIQPNREICIIDTHPGFFDGVFAAYNVPILEC